jgi:hypothetical protein
VNVADVFFGFVIGMPTGVVITLIVVGSLNYLERRYLKQVRR